MIMTETNQELQGIASFIKEQMELWMSPASRSR